MAPLQREVADADESLKKLGGEEFQIMTENCRKISRYVPASISAEEMFAESNDKMVWPMAFTNKDGRFRFAELSPGRYLLIINRTEFERSRARETFRHLPRLFFPGVSDVSGATVIVVGKDDEAREYEFRVP